WGKPSSRRTAGGTRTCDTRMEKLVRPSRAACQTAMELAGAVVSKPTAKNTPRSPGSILRGGFETHGEEYYLAIGVLACDGDGIHGGVGDAHVAAFGFDAEEIAGGAGDAEHVAVGDEGHAGHGGDGDGPIDDVERGHADGAAGSVDEFELPREKLIDAVAHERVGLAAADFHQDPG